jgi:hypothetical protein
MSDNYELAAFSREDLIFDRARLNGLGGVREPKPKAEEPAVQTAAKEGA